jgi:HAMP domain-containing protein
MKLSQLVPRRKSGKASSLNTKLIAAFIVIGVIPAAIIGWYGVSSATTSLQELQGERLSEAAQADGESIDRNLFERYGDVQAFAANPRAMANPEARQAIVDLLTVNYAIYDLMLITDVNGVVLAANSVDGAGQPIDSSALVGADVSGEEWFRTMITGDSPTGATYYTDGHQHPLVQAVYGDDRVTLPFTAAIRDNTGAIVGVWHNEASFDRIVGQILDERVERLGLKGIEGVETQLLRSDGVALADEHPDEVLTTNIVTETGLAGASASIAGNGDWGYFIETPDPIEEHPNPHEQVVGYASMDGALGFPGYGWGVLIRQSSEIAAAPAIAARNAMLAIFGVVVLAIGAVGFWLARGISGPLKRNAAKLQKVAGGDLTVTFDVDRNDEVGQTAEALNTALQSIGATLAEVESSGAALAGSAGGLTALSATSSG